MDLSLDQTHLILSLTSSAQAEREGYSALALLRTSYPTGQGVEKYPVRGFVGSLALARRKDTLYLAVTVGANDSGLRYVGVGEWGAPTMGRRDSEISPNPVEVNEWSAGMTLSPRSFPYGNTGMYVVDKKRSSLTAFLLMNDLTNGSIAGNATSTGLRDMAFMSDRCSIFICGSNDGTGYIRWIYNKSPQLSFESNETLAVYNSAEGIAGLALRENDSHVILYVGTRDGDLIAVPINKSALTCPSQTSDGSPPANSPSSLSSPSPASHSPRQADGGPTPAVHSVSPSPPTQTSLDKSPSRSARSRQIGLAAAAVVLIAATVAFVCFVSRRRRSSSSAGRKAMQARNLSSSVGSAGQPVNDMTSPDPDVEREQVEYSSGLQSSRIPVALPLSPPPSPSCKLFSLASLSACTDNFADSHRIPIAATCGTFGEVYRGSIGGTEVAIKLRRGRLTENLRRQFLWEVSTWSRLQHDHLLPLIGYCQEDDYCVLVYPYFSGGNLHSRLHDRMRLGVGVGAAGVGGNSLSSPPPPPPLPPSLTLIQRLQIGFQIAKAVHYLHERAGQPIIHRSIKSSNVLLSNQPGGQVRGGGGGGGGGGGEVSAVLADCEWATMCEKVFEVTHDEFVKAATASGTFGYISPEYLLASQLSEKNDVYAVGVILFEMLTGRKAVMLAPSGIGCMTLADWANPFLRDRKPSPTPKGNRPPPLLAPPPANLPPAAPPAGAGGPQQRANLPQSLLDTSLKEQATMPLMKKMAMKALQLASKCTDDEEKRRPSIGYVVDEFRRILVLGESDSRSRFLVSR
ncbi:hypothetical protein CBR_g23621 [Chara braunii]|uniref:Protein kinase domain-containing protein n=1 Tax=Chara braunii TaxID=69332 RepID=A0A388L4X3_CHABU|nr:hypothetical protein CBR_g23621 [Chara braunii]|eukprot:GBG77292.1 hypothetical protein CBR_g23621 [Chara braunii]